MFAKISSINPLLPETWQNKIFLTLDIDWAHDDVVNDAIDLIETAGVAATFFVTHDTPVLERLRANSDFELGIHPNFNNLMSPNTKLNLGSEEIITQIKNIVPEATAVRSHSMTQSSVLLEQFKKFGLTHDVNHFIPHNAGMDLVPFELWNGLCRVPYFWEDDIQVIYEHRDSEKFGKLNALPLKAPGLQVYDFHPIHIFLNTENLNRYESTRPSHQHPDELIGARYDGIGIRNAFKELLEAKVS